MLTYLPQYDIIQTIMKDRQYILKIGAAAEILGVTTQTLRDWESANILIPTYKSRGGTRYYSAGKIKEFAEETQGNDRTD